MREPTMAGRGRAACLALATCGALSGCGVSVGGSSMSATVEGGVLVGGDGFILSDGAAPASQDNTRFGILLNNERGAVSVQPVTVNQTLADVAQGHASDMAQNGYLSHIGPDGATFEDRMDASDYAYDWAAENILQGTTDEASAVQGWIDSPTHRAAMLDPRAQEFGLGLEDDVYVLIVADPSGR